MVRIENFDEALAERLGGAFVPTAEIFAALTPWQISQLARHPQRPYTLDYLGLICDEFHELAGDRADNVFDGEQLLLRRRTVPGGDAATRW